MSRTLTHDETLHEIEHGPPVESGQLWRLGNDEQGWQVKRILCRYDDSKDGDRKWVYDVVHETLLRGPGPRTGQATLGVIPEYNLRRLYEPGGVPEHA